MMSLLYSEIFNVKGITLSITERSVAYGDGLFTTAKIKLGKVEFLEKHMQRLANGIERLAIDVTLEGLEKHLIKLASQFELAVLKIIVTAGEGGRGYSRSSSCSQKILITVHTFPEHYTDWQSQGVRVGIAKTQLGINPLLAGLKHLNRLEQVLVRQELDTREEDDLLVQDCTGKVIEASASNVFWKKRGSDTWLTPDLSDAGVNGIVRQHILASLENCAVVETTTERLVNIESMLICNAVMGIVPVAQFNGVKLNIDTVKKLQELLA